METIIIFLYFSFFSLLAWRNFKLALIFFVILLPAYLIRFTIGPFPSTALELSFGSIFFVWLIKHSRAGLKKIWQMSKNHKVFFVCFDLFFLASVISIFVSDMPIPSFGEWRAYFLEPMILFLILLGRAVIPTPKEESLSGETMNRERSLVGASLARDDKTQRILFWDLIWALALSTISISLYAVAQKFTGWGIATPQWTEESGRRVTAFFTSPNAVGLYLAPVIILIIPLFALVNKKTKYLLLTIEIFSVLAIIFTKSQGAFVGLGAGILVFLFLSGYKKIAMVTAVLAVIFVLVLPSMRQAVLFQDTANQNRLRLWGYTQTFLTKSLKNFVWGAGVRQFFRKVQKPYYDKKVMERLIYPHNFFLNFWTETGLMGMAAITFVVGYLFYLANKIKKYNKLWSAGLAGGLAALLVHGLVDVPYFKNDLAFLFWIIAALFFVSYANFYQSQTERL